MIGLHDALTQGDRIGVFAGAYVSAHTYYHVATWYMINKINMTAQQKIMNACAMRTLRTDI